MDFTFKRTERSNHFIVDKIFLDNGEKIFGGLFVTSDIGESQLNQMVIEFVNNKFNPVEET